MLSTSRASKSTCSSSSLLRFSTIARRSRLPTTSLHQTILSSSKRTAFSTKSTALNSSIPAIKSLKPYYVTTPIFYVNADPHIGHLYSDVIADVLARYYAYTRSGYSTYDQTGRSSFASQAPASASFPCAVPDVADRVQSIFSTGTDEHGLKIQKVAEGLGEDPRALCDRISQRFKQLADAANIGYTRFIRTTDQDHKAAVQHLWRSLRDKGYIYQGKHEGWYAVSDEAFYPEAQVRKVVGKDGSEEMQSIETGAKVEWSQEVNYKFKLSAFQQPLIDWLKANPKAIMPAQKHAEVLAEIESGLQDLSISRPSSRLSWGIGVPDDEKEHTIYVWVDALTNYLTVAGYPGFTSDPSLERTKQGKDAVVNAWPADVHVVGKDIVRFHAIYWPAMLLAAGLPLPKTILAHSHWTMNKAKMSKSRGNVANPFEAIATFGLDSLRFFLMRVGGNFGSDSDYNPSVLVEYHRKYLQGQLGNLLSRICAPKIHARLEGFPRDPETEVLIRPTKQEVEAVSDEQDALALCQALEQNLIDLPSKVDELMANFEVGKALELILESTISSTNELIQRLQPWSASTHPTVVLESLVLVTESLRISALLLQPFMPDKMQTLLDTLKIPSNKRLNPKDLVVTDKHGRLVSNVKQRGQAEGKPEPLFPKIEVEG